MLLRLIRDAAQLNNRSVGRIALSAAFLTLVGCSIAGLEIATISDVRRHPDSPALVLFLIAAEVVLGRTSVPLDRGRLTLSALSLGPAALLLNPIDATLVGLSLGLTVASRGSWRILTNGILSGTYAGLAAVVTVHVFGGGDLSIFARISVLLVLWAASWLLLAI